MNRHTKPSENFRIKDQPVLVPLVFWTDDNGDRCSIVPDLELDELFVNAVPPSERVN